MIILFWFYFECVVKFQVVLCECILIFDGGMGIMLQGYQLDELVFCGECFVGGYDSMYMYDYFGVCDLKGNNDLFMLIQLDIICGVYIVYLEVGVDLVEINIFNFICISQVDYYFEYFVYEFNCVGVVLVCVVCDVMEVKMLYKLCFVIGVFGFISCIVLLLLDVNDLGFCNVSFEEFVVNYIELVCGLIDGGVDLIMVEMIFDMFNVKVVLFVLVELFCECGGWLLVMIFGIIIDCFGCIFLGQIVEVFYYLVQYVCLLLVGLNCVFGVVDLWLYIQILVCVVDGYVSIYLNVGLFNVFGEYDEMFEQMVSVICGFVWDGLLNLVGGCCGIMLVYISVIVEVVKDCVLCVLFLLDEVVV